ncbi:MAG: hypothetical protein ACAI38_19440 [Myxococcota bacterium]
MFRSATTRRLATLQYATALVGLLTAAACSGNLPLRYGETLCDPQHPCPDGMMCADSICVPDTRSDNDIIAPTDEFQGEWDNPFPGDGNETIPNNFCRSDEQCSNGEACVDGVCRRTPCFGVTCPGVGDVCAFQCIPTSASCNDVDCIDNFEHCVNGDCVPSCDIDPCEDPGCDPVGDPNCVAGDCVNGTLCFGGFCREITPCGDDGDAFCGAGFICSLGCNTPSLCDSISCNAGWTCTIQTDGMGVQFPTCVGSPCSGLSCGPGESCIGGSCIDTCEFVPCADGGRQCASDAQICCNGVCCGEGEICRVIRDDQPGVCLRPEGICDPPCSADEVCVAGECLCAEYPNPRECGGGECCRTQTCDNPCNPNPCATNVGNPLCTVDCSLTEGYRCVNDCGGVVCPKLNTVCEPSSGDCLCGTPGTACAGTNCCVDNDPGAGFNYVCDDTCSPNPCTQALFGDNRECNRDCTQPNGFTCTNYCDGVVCGPNMTCDPANGNCVCGGDGLCVAGNLCCVNDAGTLDCRDPCSPNPCGAEACSRNCSQPGGYQCVNSCGAGQCSSDVRNPDCNPNGGACSCQNDSTGQYEICSTSTCCSDVGVCANPCGSNPCPTPSDAGNETRCVANCRTTGEDFDCVDPCAGNTCSTANTGRNPDCRPDPGNPNAPQCFCDDTNPDTVCGSGTCCEGAGCLNPCSPNQCPNDPGNPNDDAAGFTRCNVNCNDTNNYTCANPCAGNTCSTANGGRNPQCHSINGGQDPQCWCAVSSTVCAAGQCCLGSGCADPCAGNPCGGAGVCAVSCTSPGGFTCTPVCTTASCQAAAGGQNPICDPDQRCECVGDDVCAGNECCVDNTGDGTRDGCFDPCAGNPCGGTGVCVRNCSVLVGFTCSNPCSGTNCPAQNPQCDPTDPNPATRCGCGTDTCAGAECCIGGVCDDACSPDPCTTPPNTRCTAGPTACAQASGFVCSDPCGGNNCASAQAGFNPQCRPSGATGDSAQCYCDGTTDAVCVAGQCCGASGCFNPCANPVAACGTTGQCVVDCTQASGFRCDPVACEPTCVSPLVCNLSNGHCMCGSQDASTMSCGAPAQPPGTFPNACCDTNPGPGTTLQCVARACTSGAQCAAVPGQGAGCNQCNPCTGCSTSSGETGGCVNP